MKDSFDTSQRIPSDISILFIFPHVQENKKKKMFYFHLPADSLIPKTFILCATHNSNRTVCICIIICLLSISVSFTIKPIVSHFIIIVNQRKLAKKNKKRKKSCKMSSNIIKTLVYRVLFVFFFSFLFRYLLFLLLSLIVNKFTLLI